MNDVVAEDPKPDPKDTGTDASAQTDDLDQLLASIDAEFDEDTTPDKPDDRLAELEKRIESMQSISVASAIENSVQTIQESLDVKIPDIAVRGWLNEEANQDPRIQKAFKESAKDPKAWNKVLKSLAGKMSKEFGSQPDPDLNASREAVAVAMRGKPTATTDESPNLDKMNDSEFEEWKTKFG